MMGKSLRDWESRVICLCSLANHGGLLGKLNQMISFRLVNYSCRDRVLEGWQSRRHVVIIYKACGSKLY